MLATDSASDPGFVHLHVHSSYSLLEGALTIAKLAERAKAGVSVRVLYDWFGSIGTRHKYWRFLRQAGCDVRAFNPPNPFHPIAFFSRDHRKLVLADGGVSVIGGLCIADEWAGDPEKGVPPWRDTAVLIEGPASLALDLAFARTWAR